MMTASPAAREGTGPASVSSGLKLGVRPILFFLMSVFSFFPKDQQAVVGSGTFNIGVIDLVAVGLLFILVAKRGLTFRFLNRADRNLSVAFFVAIMISAYFTPYPYFTVKAIIKVVEALVIYFALIEVPDSMRPFIHRSLLAGAVLSLFFVDSRSTDSKIYSAAYMAASLYMLLQGLRNRSGSKGLVPQEMLMALAFFCISFLVYPKKGSVIAYLGACLMLVPLGVVKVRLKTVLIVGVLITLAFFVATSNQAFLHQFNAIRTFTTSEGEGDPQSLMIRYLQFLVIPTILRHGAPLGYGYSQAPAGIDQNLYDIIYNVSYQVFGFAPGDIVFHVGSNYFSDNLLFTLAVELNWLNYPVLLFLLWSCWHYFRRDKFTFVYIAYILVFSISDIDVFIYRGTGIFYLNAALFAMLARSGQDDRERASAEVTA
jgi:hypothetical protein